MPQLNSKLNKNIKKNPEYGRPLTLSTWANNSTDTNKGGAGGVRGGGGRGGGACGGVGTSTSSDQNPPKNVLMAQTK